MDDIEYFVENDAKLDILLLLTNVKIIKFGELFNKPVDGLPDSVERYTHNKIYP